MYWNVNGLKSEKRQSEEFVNSTTSNDIVFLF